MRIPTLLLLIFLLSKIILYGVVRVQLAQVAGELQGGLPVPSRPTALSVVQIAVRRLGDW